MNRLFLALLLGLSFSINHVVVAEMPVTQIYLIRHAKKEPGPDPALTGQGVQRAHHWARFFQDVGLTAVYSTDFRRTRDTASIIAKSKNLRVSLYGAKTIEAEQFIEANSGKAVLLVGHSNTIHKFANGLLGQNRYAELDESIYDAVFMVEVISGQRFARKFNLDQPALKKQLTEVPAMPQNGKPQHEKINYLEFMSNDIAASKAFFSKAFGWQFTDYGPDYTAFADEGVDGGIYSGADPVATTENGGVLTVLYSDDLEATLAKVEDAGGKIIKPIFAFPGGRRFQFLEPGGNELAVWGVDPEQSE